MFEYNFYDNINFQRNPSFDWNIINLTLFLCKFQFQFFRFFTQKNLKHVSQALHFPQTALESKLKVISKLETTSLEKEIPVRKNWWGRKSFKYFSIFIDNIKSVEEKAIMVTYSSSKTLKFKIAFLFSYIAFCSYKNIMEKMSCQS